MCGVSKQLGPKKIGKIVNNPNHRYHNYYDPATQRIDLGAFYQDRKQRKIERRQQSPWHQMVMAANDKRMAQQQQSSQPNTPTYPGIGSIFKR